uniref:Uncharacterized protein n=1 Tax=Arundo donax TaxID=35708 RepID=A0A0A9DYE6_ARUDO
MEKIVPGASAMKAKASKKDQYLLKRREAPEPSHRPAPLPDAPPAVDDGPPGFGGDPPTPPLPGSTVEDEEYMLQRRAPPVEILPAAQATEGGAAAAAALPTDVAAAAPKKATKPKKARKRERKEAADAGPAAAAADPAAADEPKKKKKKKKLSDLDADAAPTAAAAAGSGKHSAFPAPKVAVDLEGLDLKQVISDLPLAPFHGADRRISDTARSFVLAFRSKYYKKSYENDPPEEPKKGLDKPVAAAAGQSPKRKKPAARPGAAADPTKAGVKRAPSDRQEDLAVKKKAKLDKIKSLSNEKKAAGLEQKDTGGAAAGAPAGVARPAMKEKAEVAAKKKSPAPAPAARIKTPSPTALMMKFPPKSTLPSVASLKARFARFGPLNVDGIRVYWKSHMCRVIYRFRSDAEAALKYAKSNAMFGQVDAQYYLREVELSGGGEPPAPEAPLPRAELRLLETAPFRPGSSGNGAPLPMSRAVPARATGGQTPKSILKKSTDDAAASAAKEREVARVKFMLDGGDSKVEPLAPPTSGGGSNGADGGAPVRGAKSVGFASQPLQAPARSLQPPMRPAQQPPQPPRAAVTQPLPPPPPLQQHLPYQPRHTDAPLAFSSQPSQPLPYPPRHGDGMSALPGQPPLPYPPRTAGFPGQQQPYPLRSGDSGGDADGVPAWKRSEKEFKEELVRVMTGIAKMVEPLTDKNGFFPYHLFRAA